MNRSIRHIDICKHTTNTHMHTHTYIYIWIIKHGYWANVIYGIIERVPGLESGNQWLSLDWLLLAAWASVCGWEYLCRTLFSHMVFRVASDTWASLRPGVWPQPLAACALSISILILSFFLKEYKFIYLFIFGCVGSSVATRGLSLVAASRGYSSLWCTGFSLRWLLLLWSMGSRHVGFSSCGTWAQ